MTLDSTINSIREAAAKPNPTLGAAAIGTNISRPWRLSPAAIP
jgi:hypothetical protein